MTKPDGAARLGRRQNESDRAYLERERGVDIRQADSGKPPAVSRGPCPRCGVPGFRGCEHQRPFEPAPHEMPASKRGRRRTFIEKRGK